MPLTESEKIQLQGLLQRLNMDEVESADNFTLVGGMSDASKRRMDDSPSADSTKKAYAGNSVGEKVVGKTPQGKAIVLPPGVDSVSAWGQIFITFGKLRAAVTNKELSYGELYDSTDEEHVSYVRYARGRVTCGTGHIKDLAEYIVIRDADPSSSHGSQMPFIPGTQDIRRFK